jgi:hypothetical protein
MQILLGWCMMMQTPPVVKEDAYPTRMAQGWWRPLQNSIWWCRSL